MRISKLTREEYLTGQLIGRSENQLKIVYTKEYDYEKDS